MRGGPRLADRSGMYFSNARMSCPSCPLSCPSCSPVLFVLFLASKTGFDSRFTSENLKRRKFQFLRTFPNVSEAPLPTPFAEGGARPLDRPHMPPTKRATWDDISKVDKVLEKDKRFDWLAGAHRARVVSWHITAHLATSTEKLSPCGVSFARPSKSVVVAPTYPPALTPPTSPHVVSTRLNRLSLRW